MGFLVNLTRNLKAGDQKVASVPPPASLAWTVMLPGSPALQKLHELMIEQVERNESNV